MKRGLSACDPVLSYLPFLHRVLPATGTGVFLTVTPYTRMKAEQGKYKSVHKARETLEVSDTFYVLQSTNHSSL